MEKIKYHSLNSYCRQVFGQKVYKIAIDAGFTCPNRDGTIGSGGCSFCSSQGSGDFAESRTKSISQQIEDGKFRVESKMGSGPKKYIAYFQAYTNTYASVEVLRDKYMEAILHPDVLAISIATRPDCLSDSVVDLLFELNEIKPVWVELGLQTIDDNIARSFNRGYDLPVYEQALSKLTTNRNGAYHLDACGLSRPGLNVISHVILGLPGESVEMMLDTVRFVGKSESSGIKLQLLHILKNTPYEKLYEQGQIQCLEMEQYIDLVCQCLQELPDDMVVHRLTGDGDKRILVAPEWSANKKMVLNNLNKRIEAI